MSMNPDNIVNPSSTINPDKKVILITGGSRGLGAKLVERLSQNSGSIVCFTWLHSSGPAEKLTALHPGTVSFRCDQQDEEQIKSTVSSIREKFGRLDVLINNACPPFRPCDLLSADWTRFQELLDTNVKGTCLFTREAAGIMKDQGSGRIVNILSSYVLGVPPEKLSFYITAKYALWGLTKACAAELVKYGITVNAISPGLMATDLSGYLPPKLLEVFRSKHPMKRLTETGDAAGVVEFLLSDAAFFLNGVNIPVNGGEAVL